MLLVHNSIYESLGKFNNAGKVIEHICNELKNNLQSQKIDCKEDNVYFNYIDIEIINGYNVAEYVEYKSNTIYMILHCSSYQSFIDNIDDYAKLILHELLHGYEDYNRIKTGKQSLADLWDPKYGRSTYGLNSFNNVRQSLSRCRYFLDTSELNAFFSGLETDIVKLLKTKNYYIDTFDYSKFKKDLQKTELWKVYFELYEFIDSLSNLDNDQKKEIEEEYLYWFKENKNFNNIHKEIKNKWRKFESKFNQLVPKIICKNIQIKESHEFTFTVNKLKESFEL